MVQQENGGVGWGRFIILSTALIAWSNSVLFIISRSHMEALSGCLTGHQITKIYLCHGWGELY